MQMKTRKRVVDLKARAIHERIAANVRHLMNAQPVGRQGLMTTARLAGIGVGSVQSILHDPDHSPSVRVLLRLVKHFGLACIGDLTDRDPGQP